MMSVIRQKNTEKQQGKVKMLLNIFLSVDGGKYSKQSFSPFALLRQIMTQVLSFFKDDLRSRIKLKIFQNILSFSSIILLQNPAMNVFFSMISKMHQNYFLLKLQMKKTISYFFIFVFKLVSEIAQLDNFNTEFFLCNNEIAIENIFEQYDAPQLSFLLVLIFQKSHQIQIRKNILFYCCHEEIKETVYLTRILTKSHEDILIKQFLRQDSKNEYFIWISQYMFYKIFSKAMQNNVWWPRYTSNQDHTIPIYQEQGYYPLNTAPMPYCSHYQELKLKCQELEQDNQQLKKQIIELKACQEKKRKRKIVRRSEDELTKSYSCPYFLCKKQYASNLALNLHIKIKHNGGTKKQRDALAENILKAQKEGIPAPISDINLPPNYVDTYLAEKVNKNRYSFHSSADQELEEEEKNLIKQIQEQS